MQGGNNSNSSNSALLGAVKAACRALAAVAVTGVTPEAWRLAKINDNDLRVKRIFWRALHDLVLLVLTKFSLPQPKEQLTQLYVQLLGNSVNDENVTSMVQYHLRLWKYPVTDFFYSSFEDCSSRDLALALGWLMAKEQIFKRYSDIAFFQSTPPELQSFPYDITELVPAHSQKQAELVNGCAQVESLLSFSGDDKVKVRTDQMRYSLGKLEFELRDLLLTSDRYLAATHKLQLLQHYKQPNILTPYELHLIRSWRRAHHSQASSNPRHPPPSTSQQPHLFQSHTEALIAYNQAFDSRVKLAEQEKVFWKWLGSLVDEKETDEILRREDNEPRLKSNVPVENIHESFTTNKLQCSNQFESPEQSKLFSQLSSKWQQMREAVSPATYNQLKQRFQPIANELSNHVPSLQPHPSPPSGATLIHGLNYFNVTESKYSGYSGMVPKNLEESRRDTGTRYQQPNNTNPGLDNRISVVYSKKDSHPSHNTRPPHLSSQPTSAAIEAQRLLHLVNSFQQHLLLMHQKNSSLLMNLVQPKLDSQNLQLVVFK